MNLSIQSDEKGIDIHFMVRWRYLQFIAKILIPLLIGIASALAAPELLQFGRLIGLW